MAIDAATGERAVTGSPTHYSGNMGSDSGSATLLSVHGAALTEMCELTNDDRHNVDDRDLFGRSIAMYAGAILVGAPRHDTRASVSELLGGDPYDAMAIGPGAAYIFDFVNIPLPPPNLPSPTAPPPPMWPPTRNLLATGWSETAYPVLLISFLSGVTVILGLVVFNRSRLMTILKVRMGLPPPRVLPAKPASSAIVAYDEEGNAYDGEGNPVQTTRVLTMSELPDEKVAQLEKLEATVARNQQLISSLTSTKLVSTPAPATTPEDKLTLMMQKLQANQALIEALQQAPSDAAAAVTGAVSGAAAAVSGAAAAVSGVHTRTPRD